MKRWSPLMVIGTAGTTGAGLVDPLLQISDNHKKRQGHCEPCL